MKNILSACVTVLLFSLAITSLSAQETALSQKFKKESIERLNTLMIDNYVFPEVAKNTSEHLNKKMKAGHFDQFNDLKSFSDALTTEVQAINKDKHMRIRPTPEYTEPDNSPERLIEEQLDRMARSRRNTAGFVEAKKLEGNVGYLDLRGFASVDRGGPIADSYMNLLSTSDAIIIDLRKNGGGSPGMVQYLCSYFFDNKVHLNSLYWRRGDVTEEFWTLDEVKGKKLPEVPLYVLTSNYTFSGAEEFSYNMQTQKRAILVGETTGGGANPGGTMPINQDLMVFIPTGRAINPITKTNWEGVGVVPEVKVSEEEALNKAHGLAKEAAEKYRMRTNKKYKALFTDLNSHLDSYGAGASDDDIYTCLSKCHKAGLLGEGEINMMGYDHLLQQNKPKLALTIFKSNTKLFPNSANVYDSYAEALAANGEVNASYKNYKKAVEIATQTNDGNLDLFTENMKKAKAKLKKKP